MSGRPDGFGRIAVRHCGSATWQADPRFQPGTPRTASPGLGSEHRRDASCPTVGACDALARELSEIDPTVIRQLIRSGA